MRCAPCPTTLHDSFPRYSQDYRPFQTSLYLFFNFFWMSTLVFRLFQISQDFLFLRTFISPFKKFQSSKKIITWIENKYENGEQTIES